LTLATAADLRDFDELTVWLGLVAPRATPAAIIDKLQRGVAKALTDPAVVDKANAAGLFPATSTPAEFAIFIEKEAERWSKILPQTGLRYD